MTSRHNSRGVVQRLNSLVPFVLLCLVLITGCATPTSKPSPNFVRTELYFAAVEPAAWSDFLATVVTPRFPSGFSVFDMQGQWRAPSGEIRQLPSRMLVLIHDPRPETDKSVEEIRTLFKDRFRQISVLRASHPVAASF